MVSGFPHYWLHLMHLPLSINITIQIDCTKSETNKWLLIPPRQTSEKMVKYDINNLMKLLVLGGHSLWHVKIDGFGFNANNLNQTYP